MTKNVKLDFQGLRGPARELAKKEAGNIYVEEINNHLDKSSSPVSGGKYKALKKDGTPSRLFEDGDMRSQITFEEKKNGVEVGIFDDGEALKGFNHNQGDTLPRRQFIPEKDQTFKLKIEKRVRGAIREIKKNEESKKAAGATTLADIKAAIDKFDLIPENE